MIGYVTLGVRDMARAIAFYDELLCLLGAKRVHQTDRVVAWSRGHGPALSICIPFDGQPASVGNGVMVALAAGSREQVDAVHARALELGARDEGTPGSRRPGFYAGYFRDLDGNKLDVFAWV